MSRKNRFGTCDADEAHVWKVLADQGRKSREEFRSVWLPVVDEQAKRKGVWGGGCSHVGVVRCVALRRSERSCASC